MESTYFILKLKQDKSGLERDVSIERKVAEGGDYAFSTKSHEVSLKMASEFNTPYITVLDIDSYRLLYGVKLYVGYKSNVQGDIAKVIRVFGNKIATYAVSDRTQYIGRKGKITFIQDGSGQTIDINVSLVP